MKLYFPKLHPLLGANGTFFPQANFVSEQERKMLLNVCRNISLPPPSPAPSSLYSLKNIWRLADKNVSASMFPGFVKTNNKAQEEEREKHFPLAPSAI